MAVILAPPGPIANLWHNLEEVVRSTGCTVELQINHSRQIWHVSTAPMRLVLRDMVVSREGTGPLGLREPSAGAKASLAGRGWSCFAPITPCLSLAEEWAQTQ